MVSSGISNIAFASVHSEKTRGKTFLLKNEKRCSVALKKNENKGDVELTLAQKQKTLIANASSTTGVQ